MYARVGNWLHKVRMFRGLRSRAVSWSRKRVKMWLSKIAVLPWYARNPKFGTADWLIKREIIYGGFVKDVPRRRVSPKDPRSREQLRLGGMVGGDRMLHNGYAKIYENYIGPYLDGRQLLLAEFGVLRGTGLAIWCDLFPKGRILGFDIDVSHFQDNHSNLIQRGAFRSNRPEVFEYDQLTDGTTYLGTLLGGQKLNIVIDDGLHWPEAILTTFESTRPHLAPDFVYFIEDFHSLFELHGAVFEGFHCHSHGYMNVVTSRRFLD